MPASETPAASPLDREVILTVANRWVALGAALVAIAAVALRLPRLDAWALDAGEAARVYDAWIVFRGQPAPSGEPVTSVGSLLLLLEAIAFFLFGASDVVARLVPVVAGLALVALPLSVWRWIGLPAALGFAGLAAVSPTAVYASRVVSSEIVIAALALATICLIARIGTPDSLASARVIAVVTGISVATAFAAGPSAISVLVSVAIGVIVAVYACPDGVLSRGIGLLRKEIPSLLLAALIGTVVIFTRFFSYPSGVTGVIDTFREWWRLLVVSSGQPASLVIMILLVYELLAVAFAIVAVVRSRGRPREATIFSTAWLLVALSIWSFSAGREPSYVIHVVVPLLLLSGIGLGNTLVQIDWFAIRRESTGLLALVVFGLVVGLAAFGILLRRSNMRVGDVDAVLPAVAVLCLVVVPLAYLTWRLTLDEREAGHPEQPPLIYLLVLAILLGALTLRSATLLAFYRADLGIEPVAQRTATLGTLPTIERFLRLARDVGVGQGSAQDPTGSHSLAIAVEEDVTWPYVWYFREFPNLTIHPPGDAAAAGAQVVIATSETGLAEAGYTPQRWPWLNTVPAAYLTPDPAEALRALVNPGRWIDVWRFLLFRDGVPLPEPSTVAVGLTPELAGRIMPATGPFDLSDRPGPGTEPGQFKDPIGVAVTQDGAILVVDSGNARVQRFDADGDFLGIWGEGEGNATFTRTANGLGPTGIKAVPGGPVWVADTWGHRVVALDENGNIVQSIGAETIDIADDPARVDEGGGRFFGPRDIAITNDAIYVVDTGNERVQRFSPDGTFIDAWGGYGNAPDRLIEPVGIAIGPDGNVYVADSGNARISIFSPDGELVSNWPVAEWPPAVPGGLPPAFQPYLAFDAAGNLYASASNAGQVLVFNREGEATGHVLQAGNEPLAQPIGVAIAPDGNVLISDIGRDTVLTYTPPRPLEPADPGILDTEAVATP